MGTIVSAKIIKFKPAGTPAVKKDAPAAVVELKCQCEWCQMAEEFVFDGPVIFDESTPFAWGSDEVWKEVAEKARLALIQYQLKGMQI